MALLAGLFIPGTADAATIVNSTWLSGGDFGYSTPGNWSPPEVPNNTADKIYDVTAKFALVPDIDATVANLTMGATLYLDAPSYTVTGTTTFSPSSSLVLNSFSPVAVVLKASNLSNFSNGVLTGGNYSITQGDATDGPAVLQFNGAAVTKLRNANLTLSGSMARLADEFGMNALTGLAEIDEGSRFSISGQQFVTATATFTNNGVLSVSGGSNPPGAPGAFTINGTLSNFDRPTKTLLNGTYSLINASLRFPAADIVNNGASITLYPGGTILDENGADALRNFAHNLPGGTLSLHGHNFLIDRDFSNDGTLSVESGSIAVSGVVTNAGTLSAKTVSSDASITIAGALTNYDPQSRRLTGGIYKLVGSFSQRSYLSVPGADIIHNSASIDLTWNAAFVDKDGNDALRNFVDNEAAGMFSLFDRPFQAASDFTNAGTVMVTETQFTIPAAHVYRQTGGQTTVTAPAVTGDVLILGGRLSGRPRELSRFSPQGGPGTINGNVTVGAAVLDPNPLTVNGSLQLSDASHFRKTFGFITYGLYEGLILNTPLTLAGTFEILTPGGFAASSTAVIQVAHAPQISGTFSNAPNGARVATLDRTGSFVVTYTGTDVSISGYQRGPTAQLLNISTRAHVLTGDNVAIGGFIVKGTQPKKLLIRAMGPSLAAAGVSGPLQDPTIELHDSTGAIIASNDNWQDTQASAITDTGIPPPDARESAIVQTLPPGTYTAVLRGKNDATGEALVELYDLSSSQSKLSNISTRGFVDSSHVLIGGLIAGGDGQAIADVVVRAIGRGLQSQGVQSFLPDATLQVRDKDGALVTSNDDFVSPVDNQLTIPNTLWPTTATDGATRVVVPPGSYTVIVNGKDGANGNALVEIYDLNP